MSIWQKAWFAQEIAMVVALLTGVSFGQELQPGLVVEKVSAGSAGEKAGIREGDLLLDWSRGDAKGKIASPFGIGPLEMEQGARGTVTLTGLRTGQVATWSMSPIPWGVQVRPNLPEDFLSLYRQGRQLADGHKPIEAAERWREAAARVVKLQLGPDWLAS